MTVSIRWSHLSLVGIFFVLALLATACDASWQESRLTWENRERINRNIPVPQLSWSSRRYVLERYYRVLERPRLRTCTVITSRGANMSGSDLLGIAETLGVPVNLSNQMTSAKEAEPDSVYVGQNDQTVFVFRNGIAVVTEADTTAITGDCPPGIKPNTLMQKVLDYQMAQPIGSGEVNFLPPADVPSR